MSDELWPPDRDGQMIDLVQRLAEAQMTIQALLPGQMDRVVDPLKTASSQLDGVRESLRRLEETHREFVAHIPAVVCKLASDGTMLFINDAVTAIAGYHPDELQGKRWRDLLFPAEQRRRLNELCRTFLTDDVADHEMIITAKDGSLKTLSWNSYNQYLLDGTLDTIQGFGVDITERKKMEEARKQLVAVIEETSDFVAIADAKNNVLYLNGAGRKMLGIGEDEVVSNLEVSDFHPGWAAAFIQSEGIPSAVRDGIWRGDTALLGRNGREIPVSQVILAHKAPNGSFEFLSTIARDITNSKRIEDAFRYSEALLRSVTESIRDAVVCIDSYGEVVFLNNAAEDMFGYLSDDAIGRPFELFVPEILQGEYRDEFERMIATGQSSFADKIVERTGARNNGEKFPLELSFSMWTAAEEVFFTAIMRDIAESKRRGMTRGQLAKKRTDSLSTASQRLSG